MNNHIKSLPNGDFEVVPLTDPNVKGFEDHYFSQLTGKYKHFCKEWDFLAIDDTCPEFESCLCEIDSEGRGPEYYKGQRVYVAPLNQEATVIKQILHYDGPESFWGNVQLQYDDGVKGISNSWQLKKV